MRQARVGAALLAALLLASAPGVGSAHEGHRKARAAKKKASAAKKRAAAAAKKRAATAEGTATAGSAATAEGAGDSATGSATASAAATGSAATGSAAASASAPGAASAADEDDDDEEIEEVEEAAVVQTDAKKSLTPLEILGRLHPLLVHLPIGWLLLLVLADLGGVLMGREAWRKAGLPILIGTVLVMVPAVATGLINASHDTAEGDDLANVLLHRNLMFGAVGATVLALGIRAWKRDLPGAVKPLYLLLLLAAVALMSLGGHIGGRMVYGDDYLPF